MSSSFSGIVSPCSTCKNQRYISDLNGRANVCPRRTITKRYLDVQDSATDLSPLEDIEQLILTGSDDDPSLTASLKNPVYDTNRSSILVWVAALKDNPAIIDPSTGIILNPAITDPGFDTNYIFCKSLPYVPSNDEHAYFLKGALKEGETVIAHQGKNQYTASGTQLVSIAGLVDRASFLGSIKRNPVIEDNCPEGT